MDRTRTAIIVQARTGSTRLPGKICLEFGGTTMLGFLLNRIEAETNHCVHIVATTELPQDDLVEKIGLEAGWLVFRGSETDVLGRFEGALKEYGNNAETVVRICSDNPLLSGGNVMTMLDYYHRTKADFVTNANTDVVHEDGFAVEIFDCQKLMMSAKTATAEYDREHVCPNIKEIPSVETYPLDTRFSGKFSVDTLQDYIRARNIHEALKNKGDYGIVEVMNLAQKKQDDTF